MTILITADLHLNAWMRESRDPFASTAPIISHLDGLIIAGDLANNPMYQWPRALSRIGRLIDPARVWIIPGNHDYWNGHLDGDAAMRRSRMTMPDHRRIRCDEDMASGQIGPENTINVHQDHLDWLSQAMAKPWDGQRLVIAHHAPCAAAAAPLNGLSAAFASNLEVWIGTRRPDGWFFGHTHRQFSGKIHGVPINNISFGYPDEIADGTEAAHVLRGLVAITA
ncbi:metallophosphoesterase family protein [Cypionkella psychrotolerans]|uniref:metallophosphoesterase family protein n=1 Tax=Cypionkella psychrotolerans TaxID=1678131 RepID=UPI0006B6533A|nr:metallophosphoesterase [Cypionkella psychrotolerans]